MGQKLGKGSYAEAAVPFVNLSSRGLETLWTAFNDIADGFGLNVHEVQAILEQLHAELGEPKAKLASLAAALFTVLDTDSNGLIDAIEMLSALAACSGMSSASTLEFVFSCYDFDGGHTLSVDEIALALTGALAGACKLVNQVRALSCTMRKNRFGKIMLGTISAKHRLTINGQSGNA
jgi:Ca2+-binding EF-hand superfamily protein